MEQAPAAAHALTQFIEPIQSALSVYKNTKTTATYSDRTNKIVEVMQAILAQRAAIIENQASIPEQERAVFYQFLNKAAKVYLSAENPLFTLQNKFSIALLLSNTTAPLMLEDTKKMIPFFLDSKKQTILSVHKVAWDLIVGKDFRENISSFEKMQAAKRFDIETLLSDPLFDATDFIAICKPTHPPLKTGSICFHTRQELSFLGSFIISNFIIGGVTATSLASDAQTNPVVAYLASIWDKVDLHIPAGSPVPQSWLCNTLLNNHIPDLLALTKEKTPKIRLSVTDFFSIMEECSPAKVALDLLTKTQKTELYATSLEDIHLFSSHIRDPQFGFSPPDIRAMTISLSSSLKNLPPEALLPGEHEKKIVSLFQSISCKEAKHPQEQIGNESFLALKTFIATVQPFFENGCDFPPLALAQSPEALYRISSFAIEEESRKGEALFSKEERIILRELMYAHCQTAIDQSGQCIRIKGSDGSIPVHPLMLALAFPQYALLSGRSQHAYKKEALLEPLFVEGLCKDGLYSLFQLIMLPKSERSTCTPVQALQLITFFDYINSPESDENGDLVSCVLQEKSLEELLENPVVAHNRALSSMLTSLIARDRKKFQQELQQALQKKPPEAAEAPVPHRDFCTIL